MRIPDFRNEHGRSHSRIFEGGSCVGGDRIGVELRIGGSQSDFTDADAIEIGHVFDPDNIDRVGVVAAAAGKKDFGRVIGRLILGDDIGTDLEDLIINRVIQGVLIIPRRKFPGAAERI